MRRWDVWCHPPASIASSAHKHTSDIPPAGAVFSAPLGTLIPGKYLGYFFC